MIIYKNTKINDLRTPSQKTPFDFASIGYDGNEEPMKSGLEYAKQIYDNWDASQTDLNNKFDSDEKLLFFPVVDTSQAINISNFLSNCGNLISVPVLNTSNCTDMSLMYYYCGNLISVPVLNTSNCTSMNGMYSKCENLAIIPEMDTSKCKYFSGFCSGNYNLTNVPIIDLSSAEDITNMFEGCHQLNLIRFKGNPANITSLDDAFGNNWTKLKENGALYYDPAYNYDAIIAELKRTNPTWIAKPAFTPDVCTSLQITADNCYKDDTTTIIHYTAICNGINDYTGQSLEGVEIKGDIRSEKFEQNNTGAPKQVTVSYNYLGQTATTEITQSVELNPDILEFEFTGDTMEYGIDYNTHTATASPVIIKPSVNYPDMYQISFYNKSNLTKFNRFRGYSSQLTNFNSMFSDSINLTEVNISLNNINSASYMFSGCSGLKKITLEGNPASIQDFGSMFAQDPYTSGNLAENVTLIYDARYDYSNIITELKKLNPTWTVKSSFTPDVCTSLQITADNVEGNVTTTTIHYTATISGYDSITGERKENVEITGDAQSEDFGGNPSTTESRQITINYTFLNQTATTIITQAAAPTVAYEVAFDSLEDVDSWSVEGYAINDPDFKTLAQRGDKIPCMVITSTMEGSLTDWTYVVSPQITLANENNNVQFENTIYGIGDAQNIPEEIKFVIREVNGQWEEIPNAQYSLNWKEFINSGTLPIPSKYNNKNIQVAFGYKLFEDLGLAPMVFIKNVKISIQ